MTEGAQEERIQSLEAQLAESQQKLAEATHHANIRLVACAVYSYLWQQRDGWEKGPGQGECWDRIVDEVWNLGLAGVETAAKWLEDHDDEIRAAQTFNLDTARKADG